MLIVSDHGFETKRDLKVRWEQGEAIRTVEGGKDVPWDHGVDGAYHLRGSGHQERTTGCGDASVVDVTPTMLAYLGLPVARGHGRSSGDRGVFEPTRISRQHPVEYVPTRTRPARARGDESPMESPMDEGIKEKLRALGYIEYGPGRNHGRSGQMHVNIDCRFFLGDRPCVWGGPCEGCEHYAPMGDAHPRRQARGGRRRAPHDLGTASSQEGSTPSRTSPGSPTQRRLPLVERNPYIDRALPFGFASWLALSARAIRLMRLPRQGAARAPRSPASLERSRELGFGSRRRAGSSPLNEGAGYDFELGPVERDEVPREHADLPRDLLRDRRARATRDEPYSAWPARVVARVRPATCSDASNSSSRSSDSTWARAACSRTRRGHPRRYAELAAAVASELGGTSIVLGGPDDRERAEAGHRHSRRRPPSTEGTHELLDFAAIVGIMDALVTGDTLAMHIAVALGVPAVALFGPTVRRRSSSTARAARSLTPLDCAPCYSGSCDVSPSCMELDGRRETCSRRSGRLSNRHDQLRPRKKHLWTADAHRAEGRALVDAPVCVRRLRAAPGAPSGRASGFHQRLLDVAHSTTRCCSIRGVRLAYAVSGALALLLTFAPEDERAARHAGRDARVLRAMADGDPVGRPSC